MLDLIPPWALACAIVLVCAWLNRVRGGGFGGQYLPGRALLWVSVAIGLVAWTVAPAVSLELDLWIYRLVVTDARWPVAVAFGLGYLAWGMPAWGFTLARVGGEAPDRPIKGLEAWLLKLSTIAAVFVRMLFVLPGVTVVAWLIGDWWFLLAAAAFAALVTLAYVLLFRPIGRYDWLRGEVVTGALWAVLILSAAI